MQIQEQDRANKKLKYAIAEVVTKKGSNNNIQRGLFRGLQKFDTDDFLWLETGKDNFRAFNMEEHNVLSLEIYDGFSRLYTYFLADERDQKEAKKRLEEAFSALSEIALKEEGLLLDTSKFESVPEDFGRSPGKLPNTASASKTGAATASAATTGAARTTTTGYGTYSTPKPEPCSWKRSTRKPTKRALEILREKLDAIAKGEYETKLPSIKSEPKPKDEKDEKRTAANNPYTADEIYGDACAPFGHCP